MKTFLPLALIILSACSTQPQPEQSEEGGVQSFFDNLYLVQDAQGFVNSVKHYRGLSLLGSMLAPTEWWIGSSPINFNPVTGDFTKGGNVYKYISDSPDGRRYAFYRFITKSALDAGKTMEADGLYTMIALEHNPYLMGPVLFRYKFSEKDFDGGKLSLHADRLPRMVWDDEAAFIDYYKKLQSYTAIEAFPTLASYQSFIDNFAAQYWNEELVIGTTVEK